MPKKITTQRKWATPLNVITLFVGLSEAAMVTAATRTTGSIQLAFTVFAILFPALVAAAFFFILWKRPHVLYSPSEYGPHDVGAFADAMLRQPQTAPPTDTLTALTANAPDIGTPEHDEQRAADALLAALDDPYLTYLEGEVARFHAARGITSAPQLVRVLRRSQVLALTWAEFERLYAIVFGGQITILQHLNTTAQAAVDALRPFYDAAATQDPQFFTGYPFEHYLGFLQASALVQLVPAGGPDAGMVGLTLKGHSFLRFLVEARKLPKHF